MIELLDRLPLATIAFVAAAIGGIIALATGSIDYDQLLLALGVTGVGTGAIGEARNRAGKGKA